MGQAEEECAEDAETRHLPEGFPVYGTFAEKLDYLTRAVYPRNRGPHTLQEIAQAVGVSPAYVQALRRGRKTKPTIEVVEALAKFFGIPVAAFFDAKIAELVAADMKLFVALRDSDVQGIAARIAEFSPESIREIANIVESLARIEAQGQGRGNQQRP